MTTQEILDNITPEEREDLRARMEKLTAELKQCRNELCLRCGQYKMAHKGACDGCRWHKMPEVGIE